MSIIGRFQGEDGKARLIEEVSSQSIIRGNHAIAEKIVEIATLMEVSLGQDLITQGGSDNEIYFIIAGKFDILINRRPIATRVAGQHVGEMSMIDSAASRSATVRSASESVVLKISEEKFSSIADAYPKVWRLMAKDLSTRLRERAKFVKEPNLHPHIFIGTSSEYLKAGEELQAFIASDEIVVKLWTQGIFSLSSSNLESLYQASQQMDYAILILGPEDKLESRDNFYLSPRDNLVFELGLFMGAIGPDRTIFIAPRDSDFKIPSDLDGITHIKVECKKENKEIPESEIKAVAGQVLGHVGKLGVK